MQMMTIRELAEASGWPQGRIRRLIEKGKLDHLPEDGLTLVPSDAIERYIQQNLVKACPENQKGRASECGRVAQTGSSDTKIRKVESGEMNQLALRIAAKRN